MQKIILYFLLSVHPLVIFSQLFEQNFQNSASIADYIGADPSNGQFNSISTSGAGTTVTILSDGSNRLRYTRSANAGSFSRTRDFDPIPAAIMYRFDISVSGNNQAQTTAAVFQVGSGFGTANSGEPNAAVHSRIGINFTATGGQFSVRNLGAGTNSSVFMGVQTITWVINNLGGSVQYLAPDGTVELTGDDEADVWIGGIRVFDNIPATSVVNALTDLKFAFTAGSGSIDIDNLLADPVPMVPVMGQATAVNPGGFTVNWIPVPNVNEYELDISNDAGFNTITGTHRIVGGQSASYVVTGLNQLSNYFYRLRAVSNYEVGEWQSGHSLTQNTTTTAGTLPVRFGFVRAFAIGENIQIEWNNLTESDLVDYTVERSANGREFIPIRVVEPASNMGGRQDYSILDNDPLKGNNYYRIRAREHVNADVFSITVRASAEDKPKIKIISDNHYPRLIRINGKTSHREQFQISVFSMVGQLVQQETMTTGAGEFGKNIYLKNDMAAGIYYIIVAGQCCTVKSACLIK